MCIRDRYKVSGGLHGVGASVVNALSSHLRAEVRRDGAVHVQEYARGIPTGDLVCTGETKERGTIISFRPDTGIFRRIDYDFNNIVQRLKDLAYLNRGLRIDFSSNWHRRRREGDIKRSFAYEGGIADLVSEINQGLSLIHISEPTRPY